MTTNRCQPLGSRPVARRRTVRVDGLEPRRLFAIEPTPYDQFAVELINRARADPAAEAQRLGVALNEGLAAGTISAAAKQPLAVDYKLNASIRDHLNWLRTNGKFQHEGSGNSSPQGRMQAAGFNFSGASGSAENLGVTVGANTGDIADRVEELYERLFRDADIVGRGHRLNLLNGAMESVGAGISNGAYVFNNATWQAVLIGQDFAYSAGNPFLLGVVYDDTLERNDFYSPGEGVEGVVVTAINNVTGEVKSAATGVAGGWQIQVPPGTYTVKATRSGKAKAVTYTNVVVGASNVKRDFTGEQFDAAASAPSIYKLREDGQLTLNGTSAADQISVSLDDDEYLLTVNGVAERVAASGISKIIIEAGDGDDEVQVGGEVVDGLQIRGGRGVDTLAGGSGNDIIWGGDDKDVISGNSGNDTIYGEAGADNLKGNGGKDVLYGGDDADRLNGGGSADKLFGEAGNDRLYGEDGDDQLDGGGNGDRVYGGAGRDTLLGGNGIDRLYGEDGDDDLTGGKDADLLNGGPGKDRARDRSSIDTVLSIEQ